MGRDRGAAQTARLGRVLGAPLGAGGAGPPPGGGDPSWDDVLGGPPTDGRGPRHAHDDVPPRTGWRVGGVPTAAAVLALVGALVAAGLLLGVPGRPGGGELVVGPAPSTGGGPASTSGPSTAGGGRDGADAPVGADLGAPGDEGVAAPVGAGPEGLPGNGPATAAGRPPVGSGPVPGGGPGATVGGPLVVHVDGAVARPGVVTVPAGSRVSDAVAAAGGVTPAADTRLVNLARVLADGELVVVPVPGEAPSSPLGATGGAAGGLTGGGPATPGDGGAVAAGPVDLNSADAAALDALPGIGPVLAQRIVAHRDDVGPFASVEDLETVSGIGPAVMASIRDLVTV